MLQKNLLKIKFLWLLAGYYVLFLIFSLINDRFYMPDFSVYYGAAKNFISGQQVYFQQYGTALTGIFKYSPAALLFFIPFTIIPEPVARFAYFLILALILAFTFLFLETFWKERLYPQGQPEFSEKLLFFSFLVTALHFHRELELGNVNLLLLFVLTVSIYFLINQKQAFAGLLLGIAILFKPHFLVFLPWLILRNKPRVFLVSIGVILAGLVLPAIFVGWQGNLNLHSDWFTTMARHNAGERMIENRNTLHYWLYFAGLRYIFPQPGALFNYLVILMGGIIFLLFMFCNRRQMQSLASAQNNQFLMLEYFVLLALIPNITFTDTEHFLLSLPLIMLILLLWLREHVSKNGLFILTITGFLFYGGNWYEVWRRTLSIWIEKAGFLGIGNLIIISMAITYFYQRQKKSPSLKNPT